MYGVCELATNSLVQTSRLGLLGLVHSHRRA